MTFKQVYEFNRTKTREWPVPSGTLEGTPVVSPSNEPGMTITDRGDGTKTRSLAGGISFTLPNPNQGQRADSATVAVDGTWLGPVTGASGATAKNTLVYYVVADGTLTLTAGSNIVYGVTDSYPGKGTSALTAVKIGVFA